MAKIKNKKSTKINQGLFKSIKYFIKKSLYYITKFLAKSSIIILFLILTSLLTSLFYAINAKIDGSGIFGIVLAICFLTHIFMKNIKQNFNTNYLPDENLKDDSKIKNIEYYLNVLASLVPIIKAIKEMISTKKSNSHKPPKEESSQKKIKKS